jgi:DNA invertase Pin-like site-specific DNA recombinase
VQGEENAQQQLRGAQIGNSKLSESDVRSIRAASGTNQKVADEFSISVASVSRIKNRVDWGWLA